MAPSAVLLPDAAVISNPWPCDPSVRGFLCSSEATPLTDDDKFGDETRDNALSRNIDTCASDELLGITQKADTSFYQQLVTFSECQSKGLCSNQSGSWNGVQLLSWSSSLQPPSINGWILYNVLGICSSTCAEIVLSFSFGSIFMRLSISITWSPVLSVWKCLLFFSLLCLHFSPFHSPSDPSITHSNPQITSVFLPLFPPVWHHSLCYLL